MHKEVRELIDKANMLGFKVEGKDGNEHYTLVCDNGEQVRVASTPSEWRTTANCIAEMERKSGRKLPRQNAAKYRHKRTRANDFNLSKTERMGIERRDKLIAEAESLRAEFAEVVSGPTTRTTVCRARKIQQRFSSLRELLERNAYVIPDLSL